MGIFTYLEYPGDRVPEQTATGQVIRFLIATSQWLEPKAYGSGEADQTVPKLKGEKLVDFLVEYAAREGSLTVREKRGLQLMIRPPVPDLMSGRIRWEAPASHPALERSAHMRAVWHLMHLTGSPVVEAMLKGEQDAFTDRLIERDDGSEEQVRTVRANRWGLRHAFWRMWFGEPYVRFFGKDRLAAAPAFFKQPLEPGGFFVQVYEDPEEWDSEQARSASRAFEQALGRKAFYNPESPDDPLETPFA